MNSGSFAKTTAIALAAAGASVAVVSCQAASPTEDVVGKRWQVVEVFDDPTLPSAAPENQAPPTITLGQTSYAITTACGNSEGTVKWLDNSVELGKPTTTRQTECDPGAKTFATRFEALARGSYLFTVGPNGLRLSEITDTGSPDTNRGWTAVSLAER